MTAVAGRRPPSGRWVRVTTRRIQDARAGRGGGSVLLEIWGAVLTLAVLGAVLGSAVVLFGGGEVPGLGGPTASAGGDLAGGLVGLAVTGAVLGVAARLGPVGVGRSGATWWLPMPVDRRGLLRPSVLGWPAAAAVAGGFVTPLAVLALGGRAVVASVLGWVALGAAAGAVSVAAAVALQTTPAAARAGRLAAAAGDVLMVAGALAVTAVVVSDGHAWRLGPASHVVAGALAAAAVGLVVLADARAERVDGALLRHRGGVGDRVRGAVLSLDLRELSRALADTPSEVRRRSLPLHPSDARRAIVLADLVAVLRAPRALVQLAVAAVLGVAAGELLSPGILLYAAWVLTGFWAAGSVATGARHGDAVPAAERLLPLSSRASRALHGTVPLLAGLLWGVVVLGTASWRAGDATWLLLAPAWAAVAGAAAVRAAYRPPPRFLATTVSTPMGGVPTAGGMLQGVDVALAGTLPTAYALVVGSSPVIVVVQVVVAAATVVWVIWYVGRREGATRTT